MTATGLILNCATISTGILGFHPAITYASGTSPSSVAAADLLGNGRQDIVVADSSVVVDFLSNIGGGAIVRVSSRALGRSRSR